MNPPDEIPRNGWSNYEKLVINQLTELDKDIKSLDEKMHRRHGDIQARILEVQHELDRRVQSLDERMDTRIGTVQNRINDIQAADIGELKTEVALLKLKAGVWGAFAGMIPAAILVLYQVMVLE